MYFCVVKLAQYLVCEEDRMPTLINRHEILVLKLGNSFYKRQVSFLFVKTAKCKRSIRYPLLALVFTLNVYDF